MFGKKYVSMRTKQHPINVLKETRTMLYPLLIFLFLLPEQETDDKSIYRTKTLALIDCYMPDYQDVMSEHLYYPEDGVKYVNNKRVPNPTPVEDAEILKEIGTIVHESIHHYNSRNRVFVLPGEEYSMEEIKVVHSRKMVNYLKEKCPVDSLFRFDTYLGLGATLQSSNVYGIVGLLDEYSAYYHGTNASYQFWKNGQEKLSEEQLDKLKTSAMASYYACYEFEVFIGAYLSYTQKHEPEIYQETIESKGLIAAYSELHKNFHALCEEIETTFEGDSSLKYYDQKYVGPALRMLENFEDDLAKITLP